MTNHPLELSLEQKFNLASFKTQAERMSREQAIDFLIRLYEQTLVKENVYRHLLKHQWGIETAADVEKMDGI